MPVQFKDYYATLGVPRTATADEIKSAFRKLARKYHPDVAKDKKAAEEKFKEINEANEVLSDPEKRRRYDELGAEWQSGGMPAGGAAFRRGGRTGARGSAPEGDFEFGGTGFSDFFEQFFGSGGLRGFRRRGAWQEEQPEPEQGEDFEADILVTLEEALKGSTRQITVRRASEEGAPGPTKTYQVRIPPGIREGQRIRLAGQGHPGQGGGAAGDIYLRVRFASDPDFAVDGDDVTFELDLAPWEAVLGAKVTVPTLDGATALRVPPGTAAGSRLRLRGLGLPHAGGGRGDLYALIRIQVPTDPAPAEAALWEKLAKSSSFPGPGRLTLPPLAVEDWGRWPVVQGVKAGIASMPEDPAESSESAEHRDFANLYRSTIGPLRRYLARLLGNTSEAQDIAHDAYLRVMPREGRAPAQKPEALLYTAARRLAINRLKRRSISPISREAANYDVAASSAPGVAQEVMARQELGLLEQAISELPAGCRAVLLLRKIELLSHQQIADRLGITVSTVEKQHARALRLLRASLPADYGRSERVALPPLEVNR